MALTAALLTGLSGLVVNQTEINVAGNNIANANTTSFKASTALFSPQFYLTTSAGTPASSSFGGTNPSQIGLGAQVAAVTQNFTQGGLQTTGVPTDLAISGNGFFIMSDADGSNVQYTRDGAFSVNSNNQLVNTAGQVVNGYTVDNNFNIITSGAPAPLTIPPAGLGNVAKPTGTATLSGTLNTGGTVGTTGTVLTSTPLFIIGGGGAVSGTSTLENLTTTSGGTLSIFPTDTTLTLTPSIGSASLPTQTLVVNSGTTVQQFEDFLTGGYGIDTSTTTPGVAQAGAQLVPDLGGGIDVQITGNVGTANAISISNTDLTITGGGPSPIAFSQTTAANGESISTPITVYDSLGHPTTLNVNSVLVGENSIAGTSTSGATNTGTQWDFYVTSPDNYQTNSTTVKQPLVSTFGTLSFSSSGQLTSVGIPSSSGGASGANISINVGQGAHAPQAVSLNFTNVEALSGEASTVVLQSQDGIPAGQFNSFSIGSDGTITASYTNGDTETIGQVRLATFANVNGLVDQGNNEYTVGASSGAPITNEAPGSGDTGTINSGQLELSNVDLSTEFINLIIASTGYSASSKVISTSDQLLTDLLNSQR